MDHADTLRGRGENDPSGAAALPRWGAQGHPRARVFIRLAVVALIAMVLAGGFWLYNVQPFEQGSTGTVGGDPTFLRAETDLFGSGTAFIHCDQPGGLFVWGTSLRNTSPLPVTLLGAAQDAAAQDPDDTNAYWLESLASDPIPERPNQPAPDPLRKPNLSPTTIQPRGQIQLWARYRMGDLPLQEGYTITTRSLDLRISMLGVERVVDVPMNDGVAVTGPVCGS